MIIKIDPEFKDLLPPLRADEYARLEASILQSNGCIDQLKVWVYRGKNILLDGHNRYEICKKHNLDRFGIGRIEVNSRAEAMEWILLNQLGKRNLQPAHRAILAARLEKLELKLSRKNAAVQAGKAPKRNTKSSRARQTNDFQEKSVAPTTGQVQFTRTRKRTSRQIAERFDVTRGQLATARVVINTDPTLAEQIVQEKADLPKNPPRLPSRIELLQRFVLMLPVEALLVLHNKTLLELQGEKLQR